MRRNERNGRLREFTEPWRRKIVRDPARCQTTSGSLGSVADELYPSDGPASTWIAHTHLYDRFDVSPYLYVSSPEKRSGKTRLLETLEPLVRAPWRVVGPSEAVLYRKIDADHPTLLLDEVDAVFTRGRDDAHEPLRALLNAGNRRGVTIPRCVGDGVEIWLVEFDVFTPRVLAGIGALPGTVADRCIPIRLRRRAPQEAVEPFRFRDASGEARPIREALEGWALTAGDALERARTDVPTALNDRAAELWEPLLAIAELAGGNWPHRAREAAVALYGDPLAQDETLGVALLQAIKETFEAVGADRLDLVLVFRIDRAFRSVLDAATTLERLRAWGVDLRSYAEPWLDTTSPFGEALYYITAAYAQLERGILAERVRAGMDRARREGKHIGRPGGTIAPGFSERWSALRPRVLAGQVSRRKAAQVLGVGRSTILRLLEAVAKGEVS